MSDSAHPHRSFFYWYILILTVFSALSIFALPHAVEGGDAEGYINAMLILTGVSPYTFTPADMIFALQATLTTYVGLEMILLLSFLTGTITSAWLLWSAAFYFLAAIIFYRLLLKIFKSDRVSFIGGLFLAANYSFVVFGLTFFMDVAGWFFYCLSIYYLYVYVESGLQKDLYGASLAIAVGALFKENAPFAYIPLFFIILYENRLSFPNFIKKLVLPTIIAFLPMLIHHTMVFWAFDYSYFKFIQLNTRLYHYNSRLIEYVKSFGSLLNLLAPISIAGMWILIRSYYKKQLLDLGMNTKKVVFVVSVIASATPAVMWPGITQRILFMAVPGLIICACFFIQKYERYWYAFLPVVAIYAFFSFFMDSLIFPFVNLPF